MSRREGGGGLGWTSNFDPESKSAKNKIFLCSMGGGGLFGDQFPTFDPESKSAKTEISLCLIGGGGGGGGDN